ncbi:TRAP transporter large permease subunit [Advenella kashmirensis]|uniref:TRAP transporter large permease subunit n=1 Tax=Advenella kashmirensis TaxID=310575 RepID=UPI0021F80516|nr:TRAP transporter large permease subunit [Advenella kashmirensis]
MSANIILVIMFAGLTLFMLTGLPIAFVLGGLSLLITVTLWDANAVVIMVLQIFDTMRSEALLGIPLYIFMAAILQRTGVIEELYGVMEIWFGRLRGGLAIGTVLICVLMAAMTGLSALQSPQWDCWPCPKCSSGDMIRNWLPAQYARPAHSASSFHRLS